MAKAMHSVGEENGRAINNDEKHYGIVKELQECPAAGTAGRVSTK